MIAGPGLLRPLAWLAAALLLAGCEVGPDFARPAPPAVTGYTPEPLAAQTASAPVEGGEAQRFVRGLDIPGQWWALFHSPALNALVEQAIAANPTLPAAQAALRQAWEDVYAEEGSLFPSVTAGFSPSRNKTATGALSPASASGNPYYSLYAGQLNVSYAPDVFGGTRRQIESLAAQAQVLRFQLEATYLTLTSNVVAAAVQEASLRGQIAATEAIVETDGQALAIFDRQFQLGQIAGADVAAQQAALAQAQALLPPLQKQLAIERDLLTALLGRFPNQQPAQKFDLASLQLPRDLPVSLPSALVDQRPDVRAAEAQLHSASAEIGVAIANRLPQFTLTAGAGSASNLISQFVTGPGTAFWTIGGNAAQTLFDAGTPSPQATRRRSRLRPGRGAISQHGHRRVSERRRQLARAASRRRYAESRGRRAGSRRRQPRDHPPPARARRRQLSGLADRAEHLSAGIDECGAGAGQPLCRHRGAVPGAGRRLVEPCRRSLRRGQDRRRLSLVVLRAPAKRGRRPFPGA